MAITNEQFDLEMRSSVNKTSARICMRPVLFHKIENMSAVSNFECMCGKSNVTESMLVEINP